MTRDDLEWSDIKLPGDDDYPYDTGKRQNNTKADDKRQTSIFDVLSAEELRDYLRKANT